MLTKFHDRTDDDYNDEMLFCLQPIPFSNPGKLKFGIKADAVIIDLGTKRYCEECFGNYN